MMQYDYYAYRKEQLSDSLSELEQAKQLSDKNARNQAIKQAAKKTIQLEPHLAYLWFWAKKEENDKEAKQAKQENNQAEEKEAKRKAKLNSESANYIRDAWQEHLTTSTIPDAFNFTPQISDLDRLPSLSFMLRVPFKLQKPYLSKDDRAFHLLDNPVRKDKVFQTPMVASTSWKGALRAALWQLDYKENNEQIIRLFGDAREDEKGQAGRLYFYPTFFDKIGLEVINPHDRKKGTSARGPIYIECVPKNATGDFVILYVPFGKTNESEVAKDLELVAKGVEAMLTVYGFGAKTSSGFGIVEQQGVGQIAIKFPYFPQRSQRPQAPEYPEKLQLFLEQYPDEDFQLKPDEWRKLKQASQPQRKSYQESRNARSTYQMELATYESEFAKWETEANAPPLPKRTEDFDTLIEMVSKAKEIADNLRQREEISHDS